MEKAVKILLALLGIGAVSYFGYREYKKELSKEIKKEKEKEDKLKEAGIDPVRYRNELGDIDSENKNLLKELYLAADTEWDIDFLDVKSGYLNENTIHLRNWEDPYRRCQTFDILMEIPKHTPGNYNKPGIIDYIKTFKYYSHEYLQNLRQLDIRTRLEGYFILMVDKKTFGMVPVPQELYSSFAIPGKTDGLADYIEHVRKEGLDTINISRYIDSPAENIKVVDAKLLFKFSLRVDELNIITLKEIVEELMDLEVMKNGNIEYGKVMYDHILFNTVGDHGNWSLLHALDFDDYEKRIVVNKFGIIDWATAKKII